MTNIKISKEFFENNRASLIAENYADRSKALLACKDYFPTGFKSLDKEIEGGYSEGLAFIGAEPGEGKTTFVTQFGYNISNNPKEHWPVLFFSLEIPKDDIITKYISMETYFNNTSDTTHAVTSAKLRSKSFIKKASDHEWNYVQKAVKKTVSKLNNVFIFDSSSSFTDIDSITEVVERFIEISPVKPVVIVDYLQYMSVPDKLITASDKTKIDYSVTRLAKLAHNNHLFVFAISALNKSDFDKSKKDMGAFSGSNRIAYDADQLYTLSSTSNNEDDTVNNTSIRDVDFTIVKHRYAKPGTVVKLSLYGKFNVFFEKEGFIEQQTINEQIKKEDPFAQSDNSNQITLFDNIQMERR